LTKEWQFESATQIDCQKWVWQSHVKNTIIRLSLIEIIKIFSWEISFYISGVKKNLGVLSKFLSASLVGGIFSVYGTGPLMIIISMPLCSYKL
jgi:hypothetical protein